MQWCIALFFSQNGAIKYNKFLKGKGINAILQPAPRIVSSSCGLSVRFEIDLVMLNGLITDDVEKIYKIEGEKYNIEYETE